MLMSSKSFHGIRSSARCRRTSNQSENRQDAREGGENPPLPRNCERPCPRSVAWVRAGIQPRLFAIRKPVTTGDEPSSSVFGKVAGQAQVRRPVLGVLNRLRSEGNEGATCLSDFSAATAPNISASLSYFRLPILLLFCGCCHLPCRVRSRVVTDTSGAKVTGANVVAAQQRSGRCVGCLRRPTAASRS